MPGDVHGGVEQGGGENRAGLAPRPAVENAGDGGQDHVTPVGKAHVGDVRKAEENRGGPPSGEVAMRSTRKHVLQQAAEEQLFGPRGEKENAERKERKRLPLGPLRFELNEVDRVAQWNGDAGEYDEACENEEAPVMAPADGITDAADAAEEHETRQRDVNAEKHRKNVGEASAGKRPEPVR